ncbi:response regulator transcription factor [Pseudobacteriovorax antillogorgiicola]|uniref:DNA-binding response regulator, OmpR family, contains REC and winged-helix (WHTH) domain n=1 Tax=Pseudobacteriovorax antillogorgiicola TaxID=1513793 RepID=A0A1Y6C9Z8_9BACT|nr:response regulator transcription factor [Pseudobacteriovorax antillogorgiicola]TCS49869.1 DNA-binding response OmpR family regulator [Pseudobacteriovorax antillogorgiicola]SMF43938.1 DNA-binding response regulator, OmpR family, contains REC and winged-helix (wHTH) domain [Pseudobacteriovorax antillogorgiicola]
MILLVEDDPRLGENIKVNLELRGFDVALATSLSSARSIVQNQQVTASLIDIELPDGCGLDLCIQLRERDSTLPILMISARGDEKTVVRGLEIGADDYIRKPFGMRELATRLEKLLHKYRRKENIIQFGSIVIDLDRREAYYTKTCIPLAKREFDLLVLFLNNPGRVFSRGQLIDHLSNVEIIQDRTVDSHLSHLRRKLKQVACYEVTIKSIYGTGYQLIENQADNEDKD